MDESLLLTRIHDRSRLQRALAAFARATSSMEATNIRLDLEKPDVTYDIFERVQDLALDNVRSGAFAGTESVIRELMEAKVALQDHETALRMAKRGHDPDFLRDTNAPRDVLWLDIILSALLGLAGIRM